MNLEKEVDLLTQSWEDGEQYKKLCQPTLRDYVTNKQFPLEKRFAVWSKWCDKIEHPWIVDRQNSPIIRKLVDKWLDDFHRYKDYDWEYFLELVEDHQGDEDWIPSVEDFKELLIEYNFGSFTMDW